MADQAPQSQEPQDQAPLAPELAGLNPSAEPPEGHDSGLTPSPENPEQPEPQEPQEAPEPPAHAHPQPPPEPPERSGCLGCIVFVFLLILLAGAVAGGGYAWLQSWSKRSFGTPGEHALKISPKTTTRQIASRLRREGLLDNDVIFLVWLKTQPQPHPIQAGVYHIKTPISPSALAQALRHGLFERTLTIPEGWTAAQVAARLVRDKWITEPKEWLDLVALPQPAEVAGVALPEGSEGYLFPETYRLEENTKPEEILKRMLARFRYEWEHLEPARRDPRSAGLTTTQVVVLAAMIEREARTTREMPQIASVYLNRLQKKMKLQCCATVRYALGGVWDRPLLYSDLKINSPYNTYQNPGLPPGPIASPSRNALAAVLRPARTDYLFYVYAGNNKHIYSKTYAEHMKAVKAARKNNPHETIPEQSE